MAITTTRYQSPALGRFVTFTAILPFEDFGHYMHPNPHPFAMEKPSENVVPAPWDYGG